MHGWYCKGGVILMVLVKAGFADQQDDRKGLLVSINRTWGLLLIIHMTYTGCGSNTIQLSIQIFTWLH